MGRGVTWGSSRGGGVEIPLDITLPVGMRPLVELLIVCKKINIS